MAFYYRGKINDVESALCAGGAYNNAMTQAEGTTRADCPMPSGAPGSASNLTSAQTDAFNKDGDKYLVLGWATDIIAGVAGSRSMRSTRASSPRNPTAASARRSSAMVPWKIGSPPRRSLDAVTRSGTGTN
jgi:hypothetical protein